MRQRQRRFPHRHGPAVHDGEPGHDHARRRSRRRVDGRWRQRERGGQPPGVPHGERQRVPPGRAAQLHQGRNDGRRGQHRGRFADDQRAVAGDQADPVRERHHPLQPVLGEQHRDAEVVHQPGDRGQHVLRGGRVEGRGRLVEHQQSRMHGQHRADRHPLLLPARQGAQVSVPQVGDAEQVEGLLDPAPHGLGREPELLHAVGELLLDRVGDESGQRVLADVPDRVRPLPRRRVQHRHPVEQYVAPERAAREPRHQPGHHPEQGRLPGPGRPGDQDQLTLLDRQRDVREHWCVVVVAERDAAQLQQRHQATTRGSGAAATAASPSSAPTSATNVTWGNDVRSG